MCGIGKSFKSIRKAFEWDVKDLTLTGSVLWGLVNIYWLSLEKKIKTQKKHIFLM